jgi:hypothetical protein
VKDEARIRIGINPEDNPPAGAFPSHGFMNYSGHFFSILSLPEGSFFAKIVKTLRKMGKP